MRSARQTTLVQLTHRFKSVGCRNTEPNQPVSTRSPYKCMHLLPDLTLLFTCKLQLDFRDQDMVRHGDILRVNLESRVAEKKDKVIYDKI